MAELELKPRFPTPCYVAAMCPWRFVGPLLCFLPHLPQLLWPSPTTNSWISYSRPASSFMVGWRAKFFSLSSSPIDLLLRNPDQPKPPMLALGGHLELEDSLTEIICGLKCLSIDAIYTSDYPNESLFYIYLFKTPVLNGHGRQLDIGLYTGHSLCWIGVSSYFQMRDWSSLILMNLSTAYISKWYNLGLILGS